MLYRRRQGTYVHTSSSAWGSTDRRQSCCMLAASLLFAVCRSHVSDFDFLSVRSVGTRSPPSSSSASSPSSVDVLCVRSPRTSSLTFVSRVQLYWPFKKQQRHTLLVFLRIPTCVPFTPSELLSCHVIFSLQGVFAVSVHKEVCGPITK